MKRRSVCSRLNTYPFKPRVVCRGDAAKAVIRQTNLRRNKVNTFIKAVLDGLFLFLAHAAGNHNLVTHLVVVGVAVQVTDLGVDPRQPAKRVVHRFIKRRIRVSDVGIFIEAVDHVQHGLLNAPIAPADGFRRSLVVPSNPECERLVAVVLLVNAEAPVLVLEELVVPCLPAVSLLEPLQHQLFRQASAHASSSSSKS